MEYPLMVTPFELVTFEDMNKKQVEEYFQWFMSERENRLRQLEQYANYNNNHKIAFNKSSESLIPIWEWFESQIEWEEKSSEEIQEELRNTPQWLHQEILSNTKRESVLTIALACDIAIYFSETMIFNNPQIKWGYLLKPKKLDGVKQPILLGFKHGISVNPRRLVSVCLLRSSRNSNKYELYETYNIWIEEI